MWQNLPTVQDRCGSEKGILMLSHKSLPGGLCQKCLRDSRMSSAVEASRMGPMTTVPRAERCMQLIGFTSYIWLAEVQHKVCWLGQEEQRLAQWDYDEQIRNVTQASDNTSGVSTAVLARAARAARRIWLMRVEHIGKPCIHTLYGWQTGTRVAEIGQKARRVQEGASWPWVKATPDK